MSAGCGTDGYSFPQMRPSKWSPMTWLILAVFVCVCAVFSQSYEGRVDIWKSNSRYCREVTIPGAKAGADRDTDIEDFARAAAAARRASGDLDVAEQYEQIADRALRRADQSLARAAIPCSRRFPKPEIRLIP